MLEYLLLIDFYKYISLRNFINISSVNRALYTNYANNEYIWEYYARQKFSTDFWQKAMLQPIQTWKFSLVNILQFERKLLTMGNSLWKENDYFKFWRYKNLL